MQTGICLVLSTVSYGLFITEYPQSVNNFYIAVNSACLAIVMLDGGIIAWMTTVIVQITAIILYLNDCCRSEYWCDDN